MREVLKGPCRSFRDSLILSTTANLTASNQSGTSFQHVTLGLANQLLKHAIDCADKVVERTLQLLKNVWRN
jgi:hypothetical protein